jgi:hypothetical protein
MIDYRTILIASLAGKSVGGSINFAIQMEKEGKAVWTGNQWNEDWAWKREALEQMTTEKLEELFTENYLKK